MRLVFSSPLDQVWTCGLKHTSTRRQRVRGISAAVPASSALEGSILCTAGERQGSDPSPSPPATPRTCVHARMRTERQAGYTQ